MTKKEWFADWFNTPYYHTLYKHRDDQEAELFIKRLLDYLKLKSGMGLKCVLGTPISFLLLLFSFLYFTAKEQRLREGRKDLSL